MERNLIEFTLPFTQFVLFLFELRKQKMNSTRYLGANKSGLAVINTSSFEVGDSIYCIKKILYLCKFRVKFKRKLKTIIKINRK